MGRAGFVEVGEGQDGYGGGGVECRGGEEQRKDGKNFHADFRVTYCQGGGGLALGANKGGPSAPCVQGYNSTRGSCPVSWSFDVVREAIELCIVEDGLPEQALEFVGIQRVVMAA